MSCLIIYNKLVICSGNRFRLNQTPTPGYSHFRLCSMGILFPLSFESNSIADWLDYGDSVLCFPKNTNLKAVLLTTDSRLVEITIVNDNGVYDSSTVIIPISTDTKYYLDKDNDVTAGLSLAMTEKDPISAVTKIMSASYADTFKKFEYMDLLKIVEGASSDTGIFGKKAIPFRNPNFKEKK